eukprot:6194653-Pleurochrysis_carterae.AAC.1
MRGYVRARACKDDSLHCNKEHHMNVKSKGCVYVLARVGTSVHTCLHACVHASGYKWLGTARVFCVGSACTSTGMCGTDWQASSSTSAPTCFAAATTSATG